MKTTGIESTDRYEVVREIGRGGMGTVYEVIDTVRDHRVALKTISEIDARGVTHLKREFRTVAELRHPYLTTLYDLVANQESCFFTMELVSGDDPRTWVCHKEVDSDLVFAKTTIAPLDSPLFIETPGTPGALHSLSNATEVRARVPGAIKFDEKQLRPCLAQIAEALGFLHDHGKVHRDIKPSNIMVTSDGSVKLLDFGLAFDWVDPISGAQKQSGPLAGTVPYMAPEYLNGGKVSPAIDMYALGILAYELVTGATPFRGSFYKIINAHVEKTPTSPKAANPAVPDDLERLILDLLAKDPAQRPTAFEVQARVLGKSVTTRTKQRRSRPRFVGRDPETELLQRGLESAQTGTPHLVLVGGPSGVGKTTLVEKFLLRSGQRTMVTYRDHCYERERIPYRAFDRIVEELALELQGQIGKPGPQKLRMPLHAGALLRVFPALALVPGLDVTSVSAADPRVERERAFEAFRDVLAQHLVDRMGVFVIDDLQWADAGSFELLSLLIKTSTALPLLFLATYRTEDLASARPLRIFLDEHPDGAHVTQLRLRPLGDADIVDMVRSLTGQGVPDELVEEMAKLAAGSPYVAESIAHELAELVDSPDHNVGKATARIDVLTLENRRLDRLRPDERLAAEAASIAGGAIAFSLLRHLTALSPSVLSSALRGLQASRFLRVTPTADGEAAYDFYHDRIREVTYGNLAQDRRRNMHRELAESYERLDPAGNLERLADHWAFAGEQERGASYALRAADEAAAKLAFDHAAGLYARALKLGLPSKDRADAEEKQVNAVLWAGDFAHAASLCHSLASRSHGLAAERWLIRCAEAQIKLGEVDAGVETLEQVLAPRGLRFRAPRWRKLLGSMPMSARVLWPGPALKKWLAFIPISGPRDSKSDAETRLLQELYRVIATFLSTPYPLEAGEFVLRTLDMAQQNHDKSEQARALGMVASYLETATLGRFGGDFLGRAKTLASESGDPYATLVLHGMQVLSCLTKGDWRGMRQNFEAGDQLCESLGMTHTWERSFLWTYYGTGQYFAGNLESAGDILDTLLTKHKADDMFTRAIARTLYARTLVQLDRLDEAEEIAGLLETSSAANVGVPLMWKQSLVGDLMLARGNYEQALDFTREMKTLNHQTGLDMLPAFSSQQYEIGTIARLGLAQKESGRQRKRLARAARKSAERWLSMVQDSFYKPIAMRLVGQAQELAGHDRAARDTWEQAATVCASSGGRIQLHVLDALLQRKIPPPALRAVISQLTAGRL